MECKKPSPPHSLALTTDGEKLLRQEVESIHRTYERTTERLNHRSQPVVVAGSTCAFLVIQTERRVTFGGATSGESSEKALPKSERERAFNDSPS